MKKLLIIDDEVGMLEILALLLTRLQYEVRTASDPAVGLVLLAEEPPDLIILDLVMPGMSGWEILRQVRDNPRSREIPIIIISGDAGHAPLRSIPHVSYHTKPFPVDALIKEITRLAPTVEPTKP